jgi:hypothetical protein
MRVLEPTMTVAFLLVWVVPISNEPTSIVTRRAERAQQFVDELRNTLAIDNPVHVDVVISHPLVFAVKPEDTQRAQYVLSMEMGFLIILDDDELRAALAHELGHVWVFTHHPYLQTERLANGIGQRAVSRDNFEKLYSKLWRYEGTTGVDLDQLLGPGPLKEKHDEQSSISSPGAQ